MKKKEEKIVNDSIKKWYEVRFYTDATPQEIIKKVNNLKANIDNLWLKELK